MVKAQGHRAIRTKNEPTKLCGHFSVILFVLVSCSFKPLEITIIPTASATPKFTSTATPGEQSISTPKPIALRQISPTPSEPEPTEDLSSLISQFRNLPAESYQTIRDSSPDGGWTSSVISSVKTVNGEEYTYSRFEISSADGIVKFVPFENVEYTGLGGDFPFVAKWPSADHQLFYALGGLGDGCFIFDYDNTLTSLNLESGATRQIGPKNLGDFAISPNGEFLVFSPDSNYSASTAVSIDLLSLSDLTYQTWLIDVRDVQQIGSFVWAPDSSSFAFTAARNICLQDQQNAILRINLPSMETYILKDFGKELFQTSSWDKSGLTLVEEETENEFRMDPETGSIAPAD